MIAYEDGELPARAFMRAYRQKITVYELPAAYCRLCLAVLTVSEVAAMLSETGRELEALDCPECDAPCTLMPMRGR